MPQLNDLMTPSENTESWEGFVPLSRYRKPEGYDARMLKAMQLVEGIDPDGNRMPEHERVYRIQEALTTASFPLMFADSVEREMVSRYKVTPRLMRQICKPGTLKTFIQAKRFRMDGLSNRLQQIAEKGEYLAGNMTENRYLITLKRWGRQFDISYETLINDTLGAFNDIAGPLSDSAIATEEYLITNVFWAAAGPRAASFGNAAAATTPFTIANLETAIEAMIGTTVAQAGNPAEPIMNRPKFIEFGPALFFTVNQVLQSPDKQWVADHADAGGTFAPVSYPTSNVVSRYGLIPLMNPWLPILNTTSGATAWALYSDPRNLPAAEFATMAGKSGPEIWMKSSNQVPVGGGALASPYGGDFATDNVFWKIRYEATAALHNNLAAWASSGAG